MNNSTLTSPGYQRFDYFLQQLETILQKAGKADNPALYFYQQNARIPLFMLEALSRIYKSTQDKKLFDKLNTRFKELEDILGVTDYYDGFYKEFTGKKNMPDDIINFLLNKRDTILSLLNKKLFEDNWLEGKRIKKIRQRLLQTDWSTSSCRSRSASPTARCTTTSRSTATPPRRPSRCASRRRSPRVRSRRAT